MEILAPGALMAELAGVITSPAEGKEAAKVVDMRPEPSRPKDKAEFDALAPGSRFIDPEGSERVKPYMPQSEADFANVPEGAQFLDPEGQLRTKPTFEPVDLTAQTLYDMAVTPSEKKRALEREYPGKVKQDAQGYYVEDKGKFYRPGRSWESYAGGAAAVAAPTIGAVLGGIGGAAAAAPTGPGAIAGAAAGGAGGALLGQTFNDMVLQLAGVYDRSLGQEAANLAIAGMGGAAGAGIGTGLGAVFPTGKALVQRGISAAPEMAAKFLGAELEPMSKAVGISKKALAAGVKHPVVPPSAVFPESPHLQNIGEVFYPAFYTDKPWKKAAEAYYEGQAGHILDQLGIKREESLLSPSEAIPTRATGEKVMQRTLEESARADAALRRALEKRAEELRAGLPEKMAQREAIQRTAEESRNAAQKLIDQGFKDIEHDTDTAFKVAGASGNTGDLWEHIGNKFQAIRRGIGERARHWYGRYDEMTGGHTFSSEDLAATAQDMLDELPEEFKARNPSLVRQLAKLAGSEGEGPAISRFGGPEYTPGTTEATQLTYGQLHDLRSLFRGSADWYTLSSDFKNGALKRFSRIIDDAIHDPNAPPAVRQAAPFLDMVDKWYAKNIKIFEASQIKAIMKGLEAGEPADPAALYKTVVREGHTDLIERIKKMVGPNLWSGVRAADTRAMLDAAKTLEPGVIDARKFAAEVLDRHRGNVLDVVHGKEASAKLLAQARAIEQLAGRLDIPVAPTDTLTQVVAKAREAMDAAKAEARDDPLKVLGRETSKIENMQKRVPQQLKAQRKGDPLAFLYDASTGAMDAVDKILGSEDLILATAARFGENSPEFNALREVYVQRFFEGGPNLAAKIKNISPDVQQIMFPGVTHSQMQLLADEMSFIMQRRSMAGSTAGGMKAMSMVEHPISGEVGKYIPSLTGGLVAEPANAAGRAVRGKIYKTITMLAMRPATLRWLERGLLRGTKPEKEAMRAILRRAMLKGAGIGAGISELLTQEMR